MTSLGCNATGCGHNQDNYCCLSSIHVHGRSATTVDDTCCGDFNDEKESGMMNSTMSPKMSLSISCDATNCVHNSDKLCSADHINISGLCATDSCNTVCSSFVCR